MPDLAKARPNIKILAFLQTFEPDWRSAGRTVAAFSRAEIEAAVASDDPVGHLCRHAGAGPDAVYAIAAAARNIPFLTALVGRRVEPLPGTTTRRLHRVRAAFLGIRRRRFLLVAPEPRQLVSAAVAAAASSQPIVLVRPKRLEEALRAAVAERTAASTLVQLARIDPQLSALTCPSVRIRLVIGGGVLAATAAAVVLPEVVGLLACAMTSLAFLCLGYARYTASRRRAARPPIAPLAEADLPAYTVMLPLHHEAHMVDGLLAAIDRLDYPRSRLDVMILVESGDADTLRAATSAADRRPEVRVLVVPPGHPRTKPRALAYALAFADGDLVTVFDAEDRPDPQQLRKAAAALVRGPTRLACVQARLEIDAIRTALQAQFAIDYAALFGGYLDWLGRIEMPLPLGGTSNHFKRRALIQCFAWDPYNVTEDADLGLRLVRYGYTCDILDSVTHEEAPRHFRVWLRQRSRWIKGWMITWLVHMRRPRDLVAEVGIARMLVVQMHVMAAVGTALCYPVGMTLIGLHAAGLLPMPSLPPMVRETFEMATLVAFGYGVVGSIRLARRTIRAAGRSDLLGHTWLMPVFWLLVSLAAWRALFELFIRPHHWAKTPHAVAEAEGESRR